MSNQKYTRLKWIKGLMWFSQVLLLLFTAQWLASQYSNEQEQLKKNLTRIFTDVQQKITDSLVLTHVLDTNMAAIPGILPTSGNNNDEGDKVTLSPEGIHRILNGATISAEQQQHLFRMDTMAFNELFAAQMRQNGWDFKSSWITNADSILKGNNAIFIKSGYFTTENGVVVHNYRGYIVWRMMPQMTFVAILLVLTGLAFGLMYRSLRSHIRLAELKDDFISNMSHELKTPIATVKVALEALNNYNLIEDPQRSREYLGMVVSEMDRLELLATRVLNTSVPANGKMYLQQESYDLAALTTEVQQAVQLKLEQHNARLSIATTGSNFVLPIDKLHIQGVLLNLVDNSLKYGIAPVQMHIAITEANGRVSLEFTDNGPGIPDEYRDKVFEKFFRIPTGDRHNVKGHGLGLSYAAQVMTQHNGSIAVRNALSGGCVFTLSF